MMHHPNMHHQPMSGHPPQHLAGHQAMPAHHQMPPHQMHRENRHVTLTRMAMGPTGAHGQSLGGLGALGVHQHHAPSRAQHAQHAQIAPHTIRAMTHHPPAQHHPIQPMKQMRRPYAVGSGTAHPYGPGGVLPQYAAPHQQHPQPPAQPAHTPHTPHTPQTGLCRPLSPVLMGQTKLNNFGQYDSNTIKVATPSVNTNQGPHGCSPGRVGGEESAPMGHETEAAEAPAPAPAPAPTAAGPAPTAAAPAPAPPTAQANSKEKTPMCLVNELARYNKIKHQYRLTSETGPAHKKVFTVTLRLGETEEYTAEGSSIKRAQHAAASAALAGTTFPPPPPRLPPPHAPHAALHQHAGAVMPTVELNALAMKLCQPAVYTLLPPVGGMQRARARPPPYRLPHAPLLPAVPPGPPLSAYPRLLGPGLLYRVRVCVGGRSWLGEGATPQAARHDAAARALHDLRPHPPPPPPPPPEHDADNGDACSDILGSEVKSPVSLVHELALKRNLSVQFSVKSERGPPHMRVFVTVCTVGDMETEGEGNGKKVSKRRAAERMLDEMRRRWPPAALRARPAHDRRRPQPAKKRPRNLIKENRFGCPNGTGVESVSGGVAGAVAGSCGAGAAADNPISRLALARHAARARSPQYRVVEERGAARRREFLVQCDAPPHRATGLGPNKKTAKRRAAHNVLLAMEMTNGGEAVAPAGDNVNANNTSETKPNIDIKRKENEPVAGSVGGARGAVGGTGGEVRQPVPGVLMMDYHQRSAQTQHKANGVCESSGTSSGGAGGAMDQLMYLSQLLGFTVEFSDFPKRNHGEYLSLVSLSTEPPVMCHGGGASTAASHEQCARAALRSLRLLGLEPAASTSTSASASSHQTSTDARLQGMPGAGSKPGVLNGLAE